MRSHPIAADFAAVVAARDARELASRLTPTARLRALLPGGPIQALGRDDVTECFGDFFADFDTVEIVSSGGETVADKLLIHYRLHVTKATTQWVCTQTAVCKRADERMAVIDLLCSGFREVHHELA